MRYAVIDYWSYDSKPHSKSHPCLECREQMPRSTSNEPTYLAELVENAVLVAGQNILGCAMRLQPRARLVVKGHRQAGNDFGVELLLEGGRKVGGHLADAAAGGVSDAWVGVLEEADDAVDHLVQVGLHSLVGALGRRREGHQARVPALPVGVAEHAVDVRQDVWPHCLATERTRQPVHGTLARDWTAERDTHKKDCDKVLERFVGTRGEVRGEDRSEVPVN
jgi:hypothetical protein